MTNKTVHTYKKKICHRQRKSQINSKCLSSMTHAIRVALVTPLLNTMYQRPYSTWKKKQNVALVKPYANTRLLYTFSFGHIFCFHLPFYLAAKADKAVLVYVYMASLFEERALLDLVSGLRTLGGGQMERKKQKEKNSSVNHH